MGKSQRKNVHKQKRKSIKRVICSDRSETNDDEEYYDEELEVKEVYEVNLDILTSKWFHLMKYYGRLVNLAPYTSGEILKDYVKTNAKKKLNLHEIMVKICMSLLYFIAIYKFYFVLFI